MSWFQIWTIAWQVAVFLTPLLVGCAVLWLKAQFVTKIEFQAERNRLDGIRDSDKVERDQRYDLLKEKTADHETRLRMVEAEGASPPSRHALNATMATMQGALQAVTRGVDDLHRQMEARDGDLRRQMETMNAYLHTVIEKHLS